MARTPLTYPQALERGGLKAAQDRLAKNQDKFNEKIANLQKEIVELGNMKVSDQKSFRTAVHEHQATLSAIVDESPVA